MLFLISSAEGIDVGRLIEIYERRGVAPAVIRNALARLKKDGYVLSPKRSIYSITERGLDFITSINRKSRLLDKQWDGQWLTVMFEIPEAERKKRDTFRNELLQLGFGPLYKSVYLSPWDYTEETLRFADNHGLAEYITISRGVFVHRAPTPRQAKQLWALDELNDVYRTQIAWFRSEFMPAITPLLEDPGDGLALFVRFLELGELIADLSLNDPMLPEELLEENWLGKTCFKEMEEVLVTIAEAIPNSSPYRAFVVRFLQN